MRVILVKSEVIRGAGCTTSVKAKHTLTIITVQLWYNIVILYRLIPHDPIEDAKAQ